MLISQALRVAVQAHWFSHTGSYFPNLRDQFPIQILPDRIVPPRLIALYIVVFQRARSSLVPYTDNGPVFGP